MKILAPARNLESAKLQIESGAKEIYIGGETSVFKAFTFGGRSKYDINGMKVCVNDSELKIITEFAHKHGVSVMYTANFPFFANDVYTDKRIVNAFLDYIRNGINAGVDSIVLSDLGALLLLNEEGINHHFTLSTYQETFSCDQIYFFKKLGIDRIVLSYHVTLSEIEYISKHSDLEIEVFGHYGCSFYSDCNLKHSLGETPEDHIGTPCRNSFNLMKNGEILSKGQVLNSSLACSICSIPKINNMGIYALKLVGRDLAVNQNIIITEIYSKCLEYIESAVYGNTKEGDVIGHIKSNILPEWWVKTLCKRNQCKYISNNITESYVDV